MSAGEIAGTTWVGQARGWEMGRNGAPTLWIVIHCTQGSEGRAAAENGAAYDRQRTDGTSCHFFVDTDSVAQEVKLKDTAYAARQVSNERGIHIELTGRAEQTRAQWLDANSKPMLELAAQLCARLCHRYGMLPRWLTKGEVQGRKVKGIITHANVTAWIAGSHTDPGPNFPYDWFIGRVQSYYSPTPAPARPAPAKEDDVDPYFLVKDNTGLDKNEVWLTDYFKRRLVHNTKALVGLEKKHGKTQVVDDVTRYGEDVTAKADPKSVPKTT